MSSNVGAHRDRSAYFLSSCFCPNPANLVWTFQISFQTVRSVILLVLAGLISKANKTSLSNLSARKLNLRGIAKECGSATQTLSDWVQISLFSWSCMGKLQFSRAYFG